MIEFLFLLFLLVSLVPNNPLRKRPILTILWPVMFALVFWLIPLFLVVGLCMVTSLVLLISVIGRIRLLRLMPSLISCPRMYVLASRMILAR